MQELNEKLQLLANKIDRNEKIKIAIIGMGSVGNYLADSLISWSEENIELYIVGRDVEKMQKDVNVLKVANGIRYNKYKNIFVEKIDLEDTHSIKIFLKKVQPDFIVNSSRVYSDLKYGTISWHKIRAYGIWCPLSIKYIKNIMQAYASAGSKAIVINTSYSDAAIPWLKSAGIAFPDFGSGNLNHLIPRIKFAAAAQKNIKDIENIEVTLATSHFHDVVISKEGHCEGIEPLINISYKEQPLNLDIDKIWKACAIAMPTDAKRNMMNANSNFEIIRKITEAIKQKQTRLLHIPGMNGLLGGYPIKIDFSEGAKDFAYFNEDYFSIEEMEKVNKSSIYLDGIEDINNGCLIYTDELLHKVKQVFNVDLPKRVHFNEIDEVVSILINDVIQKVCP